MKRFYLYIALFLIYFVPHEVFAKVCSHLVQPYEHTMHILRVYGHTSPNKSTLDQFKKLNRDLKSINYLIPGKIVFVPVAKKFGENFQCYSRIFENYPAVQVTPVIHVNLPSNGYGTVTAPPLAKHYGSVQRQSASASPLPARMAGPIDDYKPLDYSLSAEYYPSFGTITSKAKSDSSKATAVSNLNHGINVTASLFPNEDFTYSFSGGYQAHSYAEFENRIFENRSHQLTKLHIGASYKISAIHSISGRVGIKTSLFLVPNDTTTITMKKLSQNEMVVGYAAKLDILNGSFYNNIFLKYDLPGSSELNPENGFGIEYNNKWIGIDQHIYFGGLFEYFSQELANYSQSTVNYGLLVGYEY